MLRRRSQYLVLCNPWLGVSQHTIATLPLAQKVHRLNPKQNWKLQEIGYDLEDTWQAFQRRAYVVLNPWPRYEVLTPAPRSISQDGRDIPLNHGVQCWVILIQDRRIWNLCDVETQLSKHDPETSFCEQVLVKTFIAVEPARTMLVEHKVGE
jgi:hypothetical protein